MNNNIKITTFVLGLMRTNTYLVENQSDKTCFLIDPATQSDNIVEYISQQGLNLKAILITHGHFDHIGGAHFFKEKYGAQIYMHKMDIDFIDNPLEFGRKFPKFEVDITVEEGDIIQLCGQKIKVMHTPGHSLGGVCYVMEDVVFCGDTVFKNGYGRYDLRGGDVVALQDSIKRIFDLQGDKTLLCGHGPSTSLVYERACSSMI